MATCFSLFRDRRQIEHPDEEQPLMPQEETPFKEHRAQNGLMANLWEAWGYYKAFAPHLFPPGNRAIRIQVVVILYFIVQDRILNVLIPLHLGKAIDGLKSETDYERVFWQLLIWSLLRHWKSISFFSDLAQNALTQTCYKELTGAALHHLLMLPAAIHDRRDTDWLQGAIELGSSLGQLFESLCFEIMPMLVDLAIASVYLGYFLRHDLAFVLGLLILVYTTTIVFRRATTTKLQAEREKASLEERHSLADSIRNWLLPRTFGHYALERSKFAEATQNYIDINYRWLTSFSLTDLILTQSTELGLTISVLLSSYQIYHHNQTIGDLVLLLSYWSTISKPLSSMAKALRNVSSYLTSAAQLYEILTTQSPVDDSGTLELNAVETISFHQVSFAYNDVPVLKHVTFSAKAGQTVAIVGKSGGGKSTIAKLLARLHDVASGSIKINGRDIRDFSLVSLRQMMTWVHQEPLLYDRSVIENLQCAKPRATMDEMEEACRRTAIHEKIESLPHKYKSRLGEHGSRLSVGERGRLCMARALLRSPQVLVLDEPTAAADPSTEVALMNVVESLKQPCITLVIAHRLSTIKNADLIIVLDSGYVVEHGRHQDLLGGGGIYAEFWSEN